MGYESRVLNVPITGRSTGENMPNLTLQVEYSIPSYHCIRPVNNRRLSFSTGVDIVTSECRLERAKGGELASRRGTLAHV